MQPPITHAQHDSPQPFDWQRRTRLELQPNPWFSPPEQYTGSARLLMTQAEIDDDPAKWKQLRRLDEAGNWRLTASEISAALGLAPQSNSSAWDLYQQKMSGAETFDGNDATEFGLYCEPFITARFAAQNPDLEVGPGGLYVSKSYPWLACTFDAIAYTRRRTPHDPGTDYYEPAGPVQEKTWANRADFGPPRSSVMPLHLRIQLLTEMVVLGSDIGWMPVMFFPQRRVVTFAIERDAAAVEDMDAIVKGGEEMIDRLNTESEPEIDYSAATTRRLLRMTEGKIDRGASVRVNQQLARRYLKARARKADAERELHLAQNELRHKLGTAELAVAKLPRSRDYAVVAKRSGGPKAGFTVAPKEWEERLLAGDYPA